MGFYKTKPNLFFDPDAISPSTEKMIHDEGEPSFLANISDNSPARSSQTGQNQLAQSLVASFVEPFGMDESATTASNISAANNDNIIETMKLCYLLGTRIKSIFTKA